MGGEKSLSIHMRKGNPQAYLRNRNGTWGGAVGKKSAQLHSESVPHPMAVTWQHAPHPWSLPLSRLALPGYRIGVNEGRVFLFVSLFFKENWKQAELTRILKERLMLLLLQHRNCLTPSQEMKSPDFIHKIRKSQH